MRLLPRLPAWIVVSVLLVPWFTVFAISFCRQPPFGPRAFRHCLIFAVCWYTISTLLAETLNLLYSPVPPKHLSIALARLLAYVGAFSFVVFVRDCLKLRRYEQARTP